MSREATGRMANSQGPGPEPTTFKDRNLALQHLVRELLVLNAWNKSHKQGDSQDAMLMFAEGAVAMIAVEHFLRMILGDRATEADTFRNLLEKATSKRTQLLVLPWDDQEDGRKKMSDVRNTLLHGNFAQAARDAGCATVEDYFRGQYAGEIETMGKILHELMIQIDPATGRRYDGQDLVDAP